MLRSLRNTILALLGDSCVETQEIIAYMNYCSEQSPSILSSFIVQSCNGARETPYPGQSGFRITPETLRTLDRRDCLYRFRFFAEEIERLVVVLRIPDIFITASRFTFTAIEALCLLLARYRSACTLGDLVILYQRSQSAISEVVKELAIWINDTWAHLLHFDVDGILSAQHMQEYADAIYRAGAPVNSIWCFIDCTIRPMCRPFRHQRQAYNGYKKVHALKYQALNTPNGLIAHLYGPEVGRRNDNYLLAESGILDLCAEHAVRPGTNGQTPAEQRFFQIFGDPAYGNNFHLLSPFAGPGVRTEAELRWNEAMAAVRIEVEHGFGGVVRLWPFLNAWWLHRVHSSPLGVHYRVGCLLTNAHNCLRPNQTSQYFDCQPPLLEQYFHL